MYLSRVQVATEGLDRGALLNLLAGDAYSNHQLLWKMFQSAQDRPFLFRQETEREQLSLTDTTRSLPLFYVLSSQIPEPVPGLLKADCKSFQPALEPGQRLIFRLRANPTVARKRANGERSGRHDVLMDAKTQCKALGGDSPGTIEEKMHRAASTWLEERAAKGGFKLDFTPQVTGYRQHYLKRKGSDIRFSSVDFEGALTVSDPARFIETLFTGLGRSKAFGCGLMMVRRG